jgi:hypothetical protein
MKAFAKENRLNINEEMDLIKVVKHFEKQWVLLISHPKQTLQVY